MFKGDKKENDDSNHLQQRHQEPARAEESQSIRLFLPIRLYRENKFYQKEQIESLKFDDKWIKAIESYFPSINRITINLKSTLKMQSEIIPIEKPKK